MSLPLSSPETVLLRLSYPNRRLMMPRLMMLTTAETQCTPERGVKVAQYSGCQTVILESAKEKVKSKLGGRRGIKCPSQTRLSSRILRLPAEKRRETPQPVSWSLIVKTVGPNT